eukprot:2031085-Prymnesium_polylepis.1
MAGRLHVTRAEGLKLQGMGCTLAERQPLPAVGMYHIFTPRFALFHGCFAGCFALFREFRGWRFHKIRGCFARVSR